MARCPSGQTGGPPPSRRRLRAHPQGLARALRRSDRRPARGQGGAGRAPASPLAGGPLGGASDLSEPGRGVARVSAPGRVGRAARRRHGPGEDPAVLLRPRWPVARGSADERVHNWAAEAARFRPSLKVSLYHDPDRALQGGPDRHELRPAQARCGEARAGRLERGGAGRGTGHQDPDSQVARAAYRLKSRWRMALTGTPVENRLDELWSQLHFPGPGAPGRPIRLRGSVRQAHRRRRSGRRRQAAGAAAALRAAAVEAGRGAKAPAADRGGGALRAHARRARGLRGHPGGDARRRSSPGFAPAARCWRRWRRSCACARRAATWGWCPGRAPRPPRKWSSCSRTSRRPRRTGSRLSAIAAPNSNPFGDTVPQEFNLRSHGSKRRLCGAAHYVEAKECDARNEGRAPAALTLVETAHHQRHLVSARGKAGTERRRGGQLALLPCALINAPSERWIRRLIE
jgi:hypothetical protein